MTDEKPLEKDTTKQLKEMDIGMEGIEGVSAIKKDEIIAAIKTAKEIPAKESKAKPGTDKSDRPFQTIATIKENIKILKEKKEDSREQIDKVTIGRLKRKIKRLKKKTRKMARSAKS